MLQWLPIALAQVKAGKTSPNLLNKMRLIICYLYWVKSITQKVYNNRMNSATLQYKIDTMFINSEKGKISDPQSFR